MSKTKKKKQTQKPKPDPRKQFAEDYFSLNTTTINADQAFKEILNAFEDIQVYWKVNGRNVGRKATLTFPQLFTAIAAHESNYGKSNIARTQNNFFGMRCVSIRETTGTCNTQNNYSRYQTPKESAEDFMLWLFYSLNSSRFTGTENEKISQLRRIIEGSTTSTGTPREFIAFMKQQGYFEDSIDNYYLGVQTAWNRLVKDQILYD